MASWLVGSSSDRVARVRARGDYVVLLGKTLHPHRAASRLPVFPLPVPASRTGELNRDFKIWYGWAVVRRQRGKITSGDVMTRVPVGLSRRSLAFYYGKVPGFTYSSLREYKSAVYS